MGTRAGLGDVGHTYATCEPKPSHTWRMVCFGFRKAIGVAPPSITAFGLRRLGVMLDQPSGAAVAPLAVLNALFEALAQRDVRCCHWKSNSHLAEAVRGETDLDLLVEQSRADVFREVAASLGFKLVRAAPGKHYPGVENHLGYDDETGRLVHLHVHYHLVLGQQHVKDYRLAIEDQLLRSTVDADGIPIPAPRMELIILALRAVLKYRLRDALKDLLGIRSPGIPRAIRTEAEWLLSNTTPEEVRRALDELGPSIPANLVLEIIGRLTSPRLRGVRLLVVREQVRWALRPMLRLPRWRATGRYAAALWRKRTHAAGIGTKRRMTLRSGGTSIAFVGSDGAGKTTVVAAVEEWLGWRLDVGSFYMGIPEPTGGRWILKNVSKLTRSAYRRTERTWGEDRLVSRRIRAVSQVSVALRRVGEAKTRLRRNRLAQRRAAAGAVVLFDRYPLPSVAVFGRAMDGARLEQEIDKPWAPAVARLVARERELYGRIAPPDRVLALSVTAAESLRRKPDHDPDGIAAKTEAIRTMVTDGTEVAVIDADQHVDRVVAEVKAKIWAWL